MTPFYADEWLTLYGGDCRTVLMELPADSVDCVVTSPPYWGLRDYGNEGQLGLERTPEEYVANLVAVFAEVRRVLKPSGTCWLNLGDSYNNRNMTRQSSHQGGLGFDSADLQKSWAELKTEGRTRMSIENGDLKEKDLVGIPWMVAFALRADGWYLRSDIIWSKPNPMPESVTDRPTKSHEYLFLLTKSARYYFDADAVRESVAEATFDRLAQNVAEQNGSTRQPGKTNGPMRAVGTTAGRNIRSVWTIATRPYPGAHFAVFPPELPERCIKAGSSERGVCPECGAPWERVVERTPMVIRPTPKREAWQAADDHARTQAGGTMLEPSTAVTLFWKPGCFCAGIDPRDDEIEPVSAVVLDPFAGSGTVGMVANRLSRRAILIDLNPEYLRQQMKRNAQTPLGLGAA